MSAISMYFFEFHGALGWEGEYHDFECDADAIRWSRERLTADDHFNAVAIYRHADHDTCGFKKFVWSDAR